jgi:endoglucanase Acf2
MKVKPIILSLALVVIVGVVTAVILVRRPTAQMDGTVTLVDQSTLRALPVKDGSSADTSHIDSSLLPPTNSWLSGMVLQKLPLPVYPMPLSFLAKENGFEVGLPDVASTPTVISGEHVPGLMTTIDHAQAFKLTRYDKVSATLSYTDSQNKTLGSLTLSEGSPYVFYKSTGDSSLMLQGIDTASAKTENNNHYLRYTKSGHDYVVMTSGDGTVSTSGGMVMLSLKQGSLATFYALPGKGTDKLQAYAGNELTDVTTSYKLSGDTIETTLAYNTANHKPTVFAAPGYQSVKDSSSSIAMYDNVYGPMSAMSGTALTTTAQRVAPSDQLDVAHLTSEHKQSLIDSLKHDAADTSVMPTDSYFAGKKLARMANLLDIAKQLGQTDVANSLASALKSELTKRLGGDYFYYDSKLHGVAADTKAFGSEDFNDHHFHYGYFIYAASILGRYDAQFVTDNQKKVNLLVADIASYDATANFPIQRNFDPYAGHSWAAGLSPFADGNNQESSSEAMNAWNGVALWGQLTHNTRLADSGAWMLASESASAKKVWRSTPDKTPATSNFSSPLTSLNFSAKRTYATFFSDEPGTKLSIQLIPMNPSMVTLRSDSTTIDQQLDAAIKDDNYNVPLGDYNLMYLGLRDPKKAISLAGAQKDTFIDDGNSRTYLNAWLFAQSDR